MLHFLDPACNNTQGPQVPLFPAAPTASYVYWYRRFTALVGLTVFFNDSTSEKSPTVYSASMWAMHPFKILGLSLGECLFRIANDLMQPFAHDPANDLISPLRQVDVIAKQRRVAGDLAAHVEDRNPFFC